MMYVYVFFFKQKTAYEMRISDWSSDVCSSDLGYPSSAELRDRDDWYLSRDSRNRLTTVIKCDSHLKPDGFIIQGERVIREGNRSTGCVHYFLMPEEKISFSVDYPRVFLRDWKRLDRKSTRLTSSH